MPGKRGNHEGNIRKRADGRWEARVLADNGERKSFYGKTRQEVTHALQDFLRQQEQGLGALNERQTITAYLTAWIAGYRQRRRITSYVRYERVIRVHLIPGIGKIQLAKLTHQ